MSFLGYEEEGRLVNVRPPDFLIAISARVFSKPISRSCSRSDGIVTVLNWDCSVSRRNGGVNERAAEGQESEWACDGKAFS